MSVFDLTQGADFERYLDLPRELHCDCPLNDYRPRESTTAHSITLELTPEEAWLQGGGDQSKHSVDGRGPKDRALPRAKREVEWDGQRPTGHR